MTQDYYTLLGVGKHATLNDVRKAFKERALALHPDKNPDGEPLFKEVTQAYQVLSDSMKRAEYNRGLGKEVRPPSAPQRRGQHKQKYGAAAPQRPATARDGNGVRYNVSGYGMRPEDHEEISEMIRRDAEVKRKAQQHQERSQAAPKPYYRTQRQTLLQKQVESLWQMHQQRWRSMYCQSSPSHTEETEEQVIEKERSRLRAHRTAREVLEQQLQASKVKEEEGQKEERREREQRVLELLKKEREDVIKKQKMQRKTFQEQDFERRNNEASEAPALPERHEFRQASSSLTPPSLAPFCASRAASPRSGSVSPSSSLYSAAETLQTNPRTRPATPQTQAPADAVDVHEDLTRSRGIPSDSEIQHLKSPALASLEILLQQKLKLVCKQQTRTPTGQAGPLAALSGPAHS